MKRLILSALGASILIVGISTVMPVQTQPQPASASQPSVFDHSNCQYPDRWSNPVNGCDNSDPAVPECIKSFNTKEAEDACIAAFVAQHPFNIDHCFASAYYCPLSTSCKQLFHSR